MQGLGSSDLQEMKLGEPTGVETECVTHSSYFGEVGKFNWRKDGMSKADELSTGSFPLCTNGTVEWISLLILEQFGVETLVSKRGLSEVEGLEELLVFSGGVLSL